MKYDLNFKLECIRKYKEGNRDFVPLGICRRTFLSHVGSWVKAFDDLGIDGLKHNSFNKQWTVEQRFDLVAKVLSGDSITNVAKNAHLNPGQIYQWVKKYREKGIIQSMSRKGICIDNCIMESFFGTLKNEMFYGHESEFKTFSDLHRAIDKYINYYNNERIKSKTKWMPLSKFSEASMLSL